MGKSSKIILFIVEGITDEISLSLVLSKIIEKNKILKFKIINGDITTQNGVDTSNILMKITENIKEFVARDIYKKSDILNVIHLADTDGAYIDDDLILEKDIESIEYDTQNIFAKNVAYIKKRNKQKSQILSKLANTNTIYKDLPYRVYFFSSNLEHVLHNRQCVKEAEKSKYADKFEDRFDTNPIRFIEFMNSPEFALTGEYKDTWDFIKKDTNSLKRYTNFNLYLNKIKTE
ncbi:hypothetical protein [Clostridium sp. FP1]|uniref:hypothetical protein n=1 Tax=Clostridium sp. FP1 TaxID=2724076 RepID=UPI0013E910F7|nr:hypothetical protein [Clostridium sp. FP1]MBZ9633682.1 hypothetical protein [Clostridium sp. FP1]